MRYTGAVEEHVRRSTRLVNGCVLGEHGVQGDVVGEIIDADIVLEGDLELRGSGAWRLCLRDASDYMTRGYTVTCRITACDASPNLTAKDVGTD